MRTLAARLRGFYGEHPLHLLVLLACFALAGYTAVQVVTDQQWPWMLVWFLAAVVGHDLVLFPVYALLDVSATSLLDVLRRHRRAGMPARVPVLNYLRIPALGAGLTLALFLPGIIRQGAFTYHTATGLTQQPFLARWLLLCAAMFVVSAVVYGIRWYASGVPVRAALAPVRAMLGRGERILVLATGAGSPVGAIASSAALYHPTADDPGVWVRTPWHDLVDVAWRAEDGALVLEHIGAESPTPAGVRLAAADELVRVTKELIATPTPTSSGGRRSMLGPVAAGALAGLASAVVVGAVTAYHGMAPVGGSLAIGLVGYGIQAVLVGVAVGLTVARERRGPAVVVSGGVLLGSLGWLLFPLSLAPLVHGHSPTWSVAAAVVAYPDLVRDVLHGGLTGVLVSVAAGYGLIRPLAPRVGRQRQGARVVIVGGGFAGISAARRFERLAVRGSPVDVTVVSDSNFLLFTPMLAEAAAGALEGRHISAPVRAAVAHTRFRYGTVRRIDVGQRIVHLDQTAGGDRDLPYDHLVLACGSVAHTLGLPGVDEHSWTLKDLTDAQRLRDHVLQLLERAEHEPDPQRRREALTFVVAGAGFAGTEMVAELFDLVHGVGRFYPGISPDEARFVLVHAGDRILPEMPPALADYAHGRLTARGIELRLGVRVTEAARDGVRLGDGEWIASRTLVWTAGNRPGPLADQLAATTGQPQLTTDSTLRVVGLDGVWAAGDCARIPDPDGEDAFCPPTAQHAIREGRTVADNVAAVVSGRPPVPFRFRTIGVLVALGRHTAVADFRGHHFAGVAAWLLWRGVYLSKLPGLEKRVRVLLDWLLDLVFSRDIVVTTPREVTAAVQPAARNR
jgi:NADH dehydrogenase